MIVNVRLIHRDQCLIHDSNEYHCIAPLFFTNQRLLETIVLLWYWCVYWVFLLNGSKRYCHSLKFNLSFCSIHPIFNVWMKSAMRLQTSYGWKKVISKFAPDELSREIKTFFIGVIPYNTTLYIDFRKNKTKEPYIDSIHMFWLEVSIGARTKVPAYKVTAKTN